MPSETKEQVKTSNLRPETHHSSHDNKPQTYILKLITQVMTTNIQPTRELQANITPKPKTNEELHM